MRHAESILRRNPILQEFQRGEETGTPKIARKGREMNYLSS